VAPTLAWPVYVAGETAHPAGGHSHVQQTQPLGHLSPAEIADWMGRASIYVLPARYEPFGLSALEAALSGCALVLGDIPSLREVWEDAALYVPPDEPNVLYETLERLIQDQKLRHQMAQRAHARAACYRPRRMGLKYWAIYQSLTDSAANRALKEQRVQIHDLFHPAAHPIAHRRPQPQRLGQLTHSTIR
jgi:glycogen synthase